MAGITATGLGSNLDVTGLVGKLMEVEKQPLAKLDLKKAAAEVKISAYASFRSTLSAFQGTLKALADNTNYSIAKGSLEDSTIGTVTTSASAAAGSYALEVTNLAQSQRLASGVFASTSDTIGTGSLTIQFGTHDTVAGTFTTNNQKATQSLTIDTAHMSLSGVRDAINSAKIGVSANIVNDGSGYRLVVSSKDTGAANSVKITVDDADGNDTDAAGLSRLAYDPLGTKNMTQIMAGEDAEMLVDGLEIKKSSNTVTDVIAGVTLNLVKTNSGSPTKINVTADSSAAVTGIDNFVKAYNELNKTITDLTRYNAATNTAGTLQADSAIRDIAADIRNGITSMVSGAVGDYKALPQIGLTFDRNGTLTLDSSKLQAAMKADPTAVQSLFASAGVVDDPLVSFAGGTSLSKAGNYAVNLTQVATRGTLTGTSAAGLTIDSSNDTLNVTVNGVATSVKLTQQVYASHSALISELQSKLNTSSPLLSASAAVDISETGGILSMTSTKYGSASTIAITGGNGAEDLFGLSPAAVAGLDVAGSLGGFVANGSGQRLTGTGSADGLKLDINGGVTGQRGTLKYGVGIAGQLDQMITGLLASKGLIASRTESLQGQVKQIEGDRTRLEERLVNVEARYTKQFNSLDQQLSSMQSMSSYLAQQLASISSIK